MPLQCSTQWDGLGHIFDHGQAWNGRNAADVVTSEGDQVTGIEKAAGLIAGRAVLLDAGRALGHDGELPDGFAITPDHLENVIAAQGVSVGRGDIVLVRTGQLARARRGGWGGYAGGPAPGLSFTCAPWLHRTEIAAIATDTWGFEVRPNEFDHAFQPLHQVVIPHIGLYIGEMWDRKPWPRTARPTAGTSSGSPPRRFPSPARSAHRSTRSPSSSPRRLSCLASVTS